jgi:DNA-binding PadR family transcriptional regulator
MSMGETNGPLAPATFLILFALASGEKHGYAIMREARALSEGGVEIGPATLYTTIRRLLDLGWIEEVETPAGEDSRRRYYAITRSGSSALHSELDRMKALVKKAKSLRLPSEEMLR